MRDKFSIPLHEGDLGTDGALVMSYPKTISDIELYATKVCVVGNPLKSDSNTESP